MPAYVRRTCALNTEARNRRRDQVTIRMEEIIEEKLRKNRDHKNPTSGLHLRYHCTVTQDKRYLLKRRSASVGTPKFLLCSRHTGANQRERP
ncbi:hypothetical protein NDU88_005042 [Pleurodeles waltl]|uniref:Uncharacterized protein n=1 Tax=Pleurodeles waltl TaxID=8319 RepID=A0AAV7TSY9_PLEWA|nr:hypothetical protein NDU88_005042 [Pleurodeles waltl]